VIPLAEIIAIGEREKNYRRRLGRRKLMELCMQCPRSTCDSASSQCLARQATAAKWRESYRRNPEPARQRARERYHRDPAARCAKNRTYREECADALREYRKRHRAANREQYNAYMREWKRRKRAAMKQEAA
jgi:hypothetical protein